MLRGENKPVMWVGSAREDLRAWPEAARRKAGFQLGLVQQGLTPDASKAISTVGAGAIEIRIRTHGGGGSLQHRVFLVTRFKEAVWVLHVFRKTTRKTSRRDIDTGKQRYAAMLRERTLREGTQGR